MKNINDIIKEEWELWGDNKPWHCSKCDRLVSSENNICNGYVEALPLDEQEIHENTYATMPITYEIFGEIIKRWNGYIPDNEKTKYYTYTVVEISEH